MTLASHKSTSRRALAARALGVLALQMSTRKLMEALTKLTEMAADSVQAVKLAVVNGAAGLIKVLAKNTGDGASGGDKDVFSAAAGLTWACVSDSHRPVWSVAATDLFPSLVLFAAASRSLWTGLLPELMRRVKDSLAAA